MSNVRLNLVERNDPLVQFTCQLKDAAGVVSAYDLTGATIECYLKPAKYLADNDASVIKYDNGAAGGASIVGTPTDGKCSVQFTANALDVSKFYHLDVIKAGKRLTFAYGDVKVTDV